VLDIYPFATTSPIYVSVAGKPIRSPESATWFIGWIERLEQQAEAHTGWNTPEERAEVLSHLAQAKAVFRQRATP
jgi:hypothetical protein